MSRRIDVELTSERDDGTWNWRAAGARQPRGVLEGRLLYPGAKPGDVVRAEADFDLEGITVISVIPPRGTRPEPERLEVIGPARTFEPVISNLTRPLREDRPPRRERDDRPDRPAREGGAGRPPRTGPGERRPPREGRPDGDRRPARGPRPERPAPPPPRPKAKKLRPGRVHRSALAAELAPEQQAIAEQLLRGGMPAVRQALDEQNSKARAEGVPEVPVDNVLAIAEELLPKVRVADWLDRADAALADADELALRDLRSVVVSADDVAREPATRDLAAQLREALDRRTKAEQEEWLADLSTSLEGGRVVRALRLSSRPPEPGTTVPPEMVVRLVEGAGAALTADIAPDRWATVLDAVAYSPVRRTVVPAGIPAEPGPELLAAVRKHAGRVPAIAKLFGIEPPEPTAARPRPERAGKGSGRPARPRPAAPPTVARPPAPPSNLPPLPPGVRRIPPPPPGLLASRPLRPVIPPPGPAGEPATPPPPGEDASVAAPSAPAPPDAEAPPAADAPPVGTVPAADAPPAAPPVDVAAPPAPGDALAVDEPPAAPVAEPPAPPTAVVEAPAPPPAAPTPAAAEASAPPVEAEPVVLETPAAGEPVLSEAPPVAAEIPAPAEPALPAEAVALVGEGTPYPPSPDPGPAGDALVDPSGPDAPPEPPGAEAPVPDPAAPPLPPTTKACPRPRARRPAGQGRREKTVARLPRPA